MPGKNFIVRMADRLRAGHAGAPTADRDSARDFVSRQHILAALYIRLKRLMAGDARFSSTRCSASPSVDAPVRLQLRHGEAIVTIRIAPDSEYFLVSGSGIGKRFSANPAHLQSDDVVLLSADESGSDPFGTEFTAADFIEDLISRSQG